MKLTDLDAQLKGDILTFDCPCKKCSTGHRAKIRLPIAPEPSGWTMTGKFPDITIRPSIRIGGNSTDELICKWHGYITDGEMVEV